jgi:hypothetical protein
MAPVFHNYEVTMKKCVCVVLALLATGSLFCEKVWMRRTVDGKATETFSERSIRTEGSSEIVSVSADGESSEISLREDGQAERYVENEKQGKILYERTGAIVRITGNYQGKKLDGTVNLKNTLWFGSMDRGLVYMIEQNLDKVVFMSINPVKPEDSMEMQFTREGEETVSGKKAIRVKFSLTGIKAKFWSARYWINAVDGSVLKYEGNNGPGTPNMLVEYLRTE